MNDPFGWQPIIALNRLSTVHNPKLQHALLPALDQKAFVTAVIGEQTELGHVPGGYFADGRRWRQIAGLDVLTRPHDVRAAKQIVRISGYRGEPVVLLSASDGPVYSAVSQVTRALFQALGLTVDFQAMDWGSVVARRTSQNPTDKGGWSAFITALDGVAMSDPGGNSRCGATARRPGLAGRPIKRWSRCAMPGSTRRTWRHKRRSPSKCSVGAWRPCPTSRLAKFFSRPRSARTSTTS